MTEATEQEQFWRGDFGDQYVDRNRGAGWIAANAALFCDGFARTSKIGSVLELGCNVGLNLMAIRQLLPDASLSAVEINAKAAAECRSNVPGIDLTENSILEFQPDRAWEFVFTKGVLIHINPDRLSDVYDLMHRSSSRYIFIAEYYNPSPVSIPYRDHRERLFKRDFAGELLDRFSDLSLIDYGFAYHRDPNFPQDDTNWFLLEKAAR